MSLHFPLCQSCLEKSETIDDNSILLDGEVIQFDSYSSRRKSFCKKCNTEILTSSRYMRMYFFKKDIIYLCRRCDDLASKHVTTNRSYFSTRKACEGCHIQRGYGCLYRNNLHREIKELSASHPRYVCSLCLSLDKDIAPKIEIVEPKEYIYEACSCCERYVGKNMYGICPSSSFDLIRELGAKYNNFNKEHKYIVTLCSPCCSTMKSFMHHKQWDGFWLLSPKGPGIASEAMAHLSHCDLCGDETYDHELFGATKACYEALQIVSIEPC